jgi:hypothetical protein
LKGILHVSRWLHRPNSLLYALHILLIGLRATPKLNKRKGKKNIKRKTNKSGHIWTQSYWNLLEVIWVLLQTRPSSYWQRTQKRQRLQIQFLIENTAKTMPPRVLQCHPQCKQSMTTVSSIVQWVCIHSKSIVFFSSVLIYSNCASPQLIVSWSTVYTCTISPQWTVSWSTMHSYTVEIPHVLEFC